MKKYLIGGVVFAIVMALVKHLYFVHEEYDQMDAFVDARIAGGLEIPLDCPPFGKQQVKFSSENSTPEIAKQNLPLIVKQWSELWPPAYEAIDQKVKDYNARDHLTEKMEITVELPDATMDSNPKWTIEVQSVAGIFSAEFTGTKVTSSSADF